MPSVPLAVRSCFSHEVDGGWAWIVVAASFTIQLILFGIIQSYGTMFVALLSDFKSGEYETAWIGSMAYGLMFFIGPIMATLSEHFGCRKMVYMGTLICMISCFSSSFAPNLSTLYFTFGILWGIGAGMTFFPCLLVLNFYFSNRISLANGITMTGSGIGTLIFNASLNKVLELHNWRVGFRLLGGVCILMFACGSAYLPPPQDFYAIQEWQQYQKVKFSTKLSRILDIRPWKEKAFIVWLIGISFALFGYFVPYIHLARFGETLNVPLSKGTLLVGYMSISQIFAKLICGHLADTRRIKRLQILIVSTLSFAICNFAVTAATDFIGLLAYSLIYGFFDGLFVVVLPLLIRDLVGRELMANAIGNFYGIISIPLTLGPPISGQLYDIFGSYNVPFATSGGLMLLASFMMYFVYRLRPDMIKDIPLQSDDLFTNDLITRTSIHSHTVDALSGMFLTERLSSIDNVDRASELTINPLHNFTSALSRGRAGQRFPSFDVDDRSEGRSEIFLRRLRVYEDGAIIESAPGTKIEFANASTSASPSDGDDPLHTTKEISLDFTHGSLVLTSSPRISSSTLAAESIVDIVTCQEKQYLTENSPSEGVAPEMGRNDEGSDVASFQDQEKRGHVDQENSNEPVECMTDTPREENQVLIKISSSDKFNDISSNNGSVDEADVVKERLDSTILKSPPKEDISAGEPVSPSIPLYTPITKTAPLISIDTDDEATDEMDTTLVPDDMDIDTTTDTIVPDDCSAYGDEDVIIKIPPPPTWNREAPLVDLTEANDISTLQTPLSKDDTDEAVEVQNDRTFVGNNTELLSLNERLMIMAEQQRQDGELKLIFPTDDMTLFPAYYSNIVTPSEQQGTPVCPHTPAPSTCQSPPPTSMREDFPGCSSVADDFMLHQSYTQSITSTTVHLNNITDNDHRSNDTILARIDKCNEPTEEPESNLQTFDDIVSGEERHVTVTSLSYELQNSRLDEGCLINHLQQGFVENEGQPFQSHIAQTTCGSMASNGATGITLLKPNVKALSQSLEINQPAETAATNPFMQADFDSDNIQQSRSLAHPKVHVTDLDAPTQILSDNELLTINISTSLLDKQTGKVGAVTPLPQQRLYNSNTELTPQNYPNEGLLTRASTENLLQIDFAGHNTTEDKQHDEDFMSEFQQLMLPNSSAQHNDFEIQVSHPGDIRSDSSNIILPANSMTSKNQTERECNEHQLHQQKLENDAILSPENTTTLQTNIEAKMACVFGESNSDLAQINKEYVPSIHSEGYTNPFLQQCSKSTDDIQVKVDNSSTTEATCFNTTFSATNKDLPVDQQST